MSKLWQTRQKRRFTKRCHPGNVDIGVHQNLTKCKTELVHACRKFWETVAKLWTRRCQRKEKRELKVLSRRSHAAALFPHAPKHWQTYMWGIARDRPSQSSQGDCEGKKTLKRAILPSADDCGVAGKEFCIFAPLQLSKMHVAVELRKMLLQSIFTNKNRW